MASLDSASVTKRSDLPAIKHIGLADLRDALWQGLADFNAAPTHAIFLGLVYPVVGLLLFRATFHYEIIPLLFPIVAGFAILGPFSAIGLYEISRVRELGQAVTWRNALAVMHTRSLIAILLLGAVLTGIFVTWLFAAYGIYEAFVGQAGLNQSGPASLGAMTDQVLGTRAGWKMLIVGNLVGAVFAVAAFMISVVSFPLLIDRDADAMTAVQTSIRAVTANPVAMLQWGLIVVALLVIGSLPALLGLAVVVPVLGHATWHLYRKVVA